jgi:hypothetical protein
MKIKVRGVTYETVKECAAALNVSIHGVYGALERGALDSLGLGKTKPRQITLDGLTFRSISAASVALGFNRRYLREVLRRGSENAHERVRFAVLRYKARLEMDAVRAASGKVAAE